MRTGNSDSFRWAILVVGVLFVIAGTGSTRASDRPSGTYANSPDTIQESVFDLGTIVVTATRVEEYAFESPVIVQSLSRDFVRTSRMSRTLPEALKEIPAVSIQKTSYGQGSPYIRGFTGYHTLMLVDGVRLNNSVFREGPNQYSGTIDPLLTSRIEMVKGPGSSLYGSDAVGGTVNIVTNGVPFGTSNLDLHSNLYYRYASGDNSNVGRVEVNGSLNRKAGLRAGFSDKKFGDLRPGGGPRLPRTGYGESGFDGDVEYRITDSLKLQASYQQLAQNDAWRTHRTIYGMSWDGTAVGTDRKLSLDQHRDLAFLRFSKTNRAGFLSDIKAQLSYQIQREDQNRIKSDTSSEKQGFKVRTLGVTIQAESKSKIGNFSYGVDYYRDWVNSYKRTYKPDGSLKKVEMQGPIADGSSYQEVEVYVENKMEVGERWRVIPTVRYTHVNAHADSAINPIPKQAPLKISKNWNQATASVRAMRFLDEDRQWNLFGSVGTAFRAPNLSDLSRFDIARKSEQEVPTSDLSPEHFVCYELGLKHLSRGVGAQISIFYTAINNLIIRTPLGIKITPDSLNAVTKKNSGRGYVYGFELSGQWAASKAIQVSGSASWLTGKIKTYATSAPVLSTQPIDRMMPPAVNLSIRWEPPSGKEWVEFSTAGAGAQRDLSPGDKLDDQRIPPHGTPGYAVANLRAGYRVTSTVTVSAALENITDNAYRIHGSGQNEAGRNAVVSTSISF